jgi:hypothetical protein
MVMHPLLSPEIAQAFATDWISAWNSRDLERILGHYTSDVEFTSPFIKRLMNSDRRELRGIAVLRVYFTRALNAYPDLRFALRRVYVGSETLVIEYQSVGDRLAAEMMQFNEAGLIVRVCAHYAAAHPQPAELPQMSQS